MGFSKIRTSRIEMPAVSKLLVGDVDIFGGAAVTAGTAVASQIMVLDSSLDFGSMRTLSFTGTATSISVASGSQGFAAIYVRDGSLKLHKHTATTDTYCAEFKFNFQGTTAQSFGLDCTCEIEPGGDTPANRTAGGLRALQGVARVASGFTITGGSDTGVYGQFCNLGTINGASTYPAAGYLLVEDGGTYTQVGVLQALWLDSHLTKTISAGASYFLNITNNASTTWDAAVHVYAGNKITNLFKIDTAAGLVSANDAGGSTLNFSNWKTIAIDLDGTTHYLVAAQTVANS